MAEAKVKAVLGRDILEVPALGVFLRDSRTGFFIPLDTAIVESVARNSTLLEVLKTLGGNPDSIINVYDFIDSALSIDEEVVSYTVPAGNKLMVTKISGWSSAGSEYRVRIDGVQVGGARTSASTLTFFHDHSMTPLVVNEGDSISVSVERFSGSALVKTNAIIGGVLIDG